MALYQRAARKVQIFLSLYNKEGNWAAIWCFHTSRKKREEKNRRRRRRGAAPQAPGGGAGGAKRAPQAPGGGGAGDNNTGLKLAYASELQISLALCAPWRGEGDRSYFRGAGAQVYSSAILTGKTQGKLNFSRASRAGSLRPQPRRPRGRRAAVGMIDGMLCACRCSSPVETRIIDQPTRLAVGRRHRVIRVHYHWIIYQVLELVVNNVAQQ